MEANNITPEQVKQVSDDLLSRIRAHMEAENIKQAQIADKLHLVSNNSRSLISPVLSEKRKDGKNPTLYTLIAICMALGLEVKLSKGEV